MSITIKTDRAAWKAALDAAADKAAAALADQMMNDSLDIIPKQDGNLRDAGRVVKTAEGKRDLVWDLVWDNVYAGYQWYGMRKDGSNIVKKYTTPGTSKMWVEQARAKHGDEWEKVTQNAFVEGLK
jgi:hypothetical protein